MEGFYRNKLRIVIPVLVLLAVILLFVLHKPRQGDAVKWFDTSIDPPSEDESWDYDYKNQFGKLLTLESMPGVSFTIEDTEEDGPRLFMIKDGQKEKLLERSWMLRSAYFSDISGDGVPELCVMRVVGSGMIDSRISVQDLTSLELYELADRGEYDYMFTVQNGTLTAAKYRYMFKAQDKPLREGQLLLKDGKLVIGK